MPYSLYDTHSNYIIGFHGCDQSVADELIGNSNPSFLPSNNEYDWLGNGMYFWENDFKRAEKYVEEAKTRKPENYKNPTVIGAVIDLGYCLNLTEDTHKQILKDSYEILLVAGGEIPVNKEISGEKMLRYLDKAVVEIACKMSEHNGRKYDTVRALFREGGELYPGAGFHDKTHVQIAVRNPNMIKGYFIPIKAHKFSS